MMRKAVYQMEPLDCPSCIKKIENALGRQAGIKDGKVLFHSGKVRVEFDEDQISDQQIEEVIVKLGYPVYSRKVA